MANEYNDNFYDIIRPGVISSAKAVVSALDLTPWPEKVVDVGCGEGHWGWEFLRQGSSSAMGLDGDYVEKRMIEFQEINLEDCVYPEVDGDLGICLEVAEHLTPQAADNLIGWMCKSFDIILFSGGIPGQPGAGHINCLPMSEWAEKFISQGMYVTTGLREKVLGDPEVEPWYQQNLLLISRDPSVSNLFGQTDFDRKLPKWW